MRNHMLTRGPLLLALLAAGCVDAGSEAGTKFVGVGESPGTIQAEPVEKGGIIEFTRIDLAGRFLDLGIATGVFLTGTPFDDPLPLVAGFSYLFDPPIVSMSTYSGMSPTGPAQVGSCIAVLNGRGPLGGVWDTVDVGDAITMTSNPADPWAADAVTMPVYRSPLDYPRDRGSVFVNYLEVDQALESHPIMTPNWGWDTEMSLSFPGGLPPREAPVAYIPQPSDAADERTGKEEGFPTIRTPIQLSGLSVARRGDSPQLVSFFSPETGEVSNPLPSSLQGVENGLVNESMTIRWEPGTQEGQNTTMHFQLKLLPAEAEGTTIECPDNPGEQCACNDEWDVDPADFTTDEAFLEAAGQMRKWWCDADYEPDPAREGRHYRTQECRQGLCYNAGGDRDMDDIMGSLYCTADDSAGEFEITADMMNTLASQVDMSQLDGAVLLAARANEKDVVLPATATAIGRTSSINPVRLRSAHVVVTRLAVSDGGAQ